MLNLWDTICLPKKLLEVVSIPNTLYKSQQGKYFVGQTESLIFSNTTNAWGGLFNPTDSGVNLFANVYTISNFSNAPILAQLWFNTTPPGTGSKSTKFSPSDTALLKPPVPKVEIRYQENVSDVPSGGVNVFDRIVPPGTTLVSEEDGKLIFPSGGNLVLFLSALEPAIDSYEALIAFGWWEDKK
ncbi:hypothetical protein Desor_3979 [Desulfosporosinus orientis DSM 765]|uniref:Uncharacterized protein n=1 Tax=Desulfosporosinus orientis (strain ATCC 19365 / DSM 765 / NCIMB 8382 / VKM B-1628 / Singapore I) TaxID=768706 RepID=G7WE25_DESOD|nr:DUF6143 family protein [Desulfosporosinus orientis]AET69423.1 hypothetical protein Desor_3979 [Desulfosporosinus orientis DSM 765]